MTHRTDKNTANASDRTIRNPMLYPFELRAHNNNCNQQDTSKSNYFQPFPNRPTCEQVEAITGALAPKETPERREQLERTANIWYSRGHVSRPVLGFACLMLVMFGLVFWYAHRSQNTFRYYAPTDKFRILRRYPDGYHYDFRWVHSENGRLMVRPLHLHFCDTPDSRAKNLSAGETLTFLGYEDIGSCSFISGPGLGFDFELDANGHPTSAPNCHEGPKGYRECVPNLLEAIFPEEN